MIEGKTDLPHSLFDERKVGRADFRRRRSHAQKNEARVLKGIGQLDGEAEVSFCHPLFDEILKPWFKKRHTAFFQLRDFISINVKTDNLVSQRGETHACDETDVACSNNCYVHKSINLPTEGG